MRTPCSTSVINTTVTQKDPLCRKRILGVARIHHSQGVRSFSVIMQACCNPAKESGFDVCVRHRDEGSRRIRGITDSISGTGLEAKGVLSCLTIFTLMQAHNKTHSPLRNWTKVVDHAFVQRTNISANCKKEKSLRQRNYAGLFTPTQ